jgi:hypothetical protein
VDIGREPEGVAMGFVTLTRRNVAALKSSLRRSCRQVGSAHVDEALAAGIGFNTHAALLAALKALSSGTSLTVVLNETMLFDRLRELSGVDVDPADVGRQLWQEPLPDTVDVYGFGEWWKDVANEN